MHVLIFGGTGRTGSFAVSETLKRGHTVTVLARNKPAENDRLSDLTYIQGSPLNVSDIRSAFQHMDRNGSTPDTVIVTLSSLRSSDSPFAAPIGPKNFMVDANKNILSVMEDLGLITKIKIVVMQAFGTAESWNNMHWTLRLLMSKSNMIYAYKEHDEVSKMVEKSGAKFVLARPVRLVEGKEQNVKIWNENGKGVPLMAGISRESVATWLVDAAEGSEWDGKAVVFSN